MGRGQIGGAALACGFGAAPPPPNGNPNGDGDGAASLGASFGGACGLG